VTLRELIDQVDIQRGGCFMSLFSKIRTFWHNFMLGYNQTILEGCLDEELKEKIRNKIDHHRLKLIRD
jgi:hypothetical protein